MGYAFLIATCCACQAPVVCNPNKVPSLRLNGKKEPLCSHCAERWNEIHRTSKGLPPIPINAGAYEACPEEEL